MKKLIFGLLSVAVIGFIFYLFAYRKDDDDDDTGNGEATTTPPPPPVNEKEIIYDPYSGEGELAVKAQIKNIVRRPEKIKELRETYGIGTDIFRNVDPQGAKDIIQNDVHKQTGAGTDSQIPILPQSYNPDFDRQMQRLKETAERMPELYENLGREGSMEKLKKDADFQAIAGFSLVPSFVNYDLICDDRGYGKCPLGLFGRVDNGTRKAYKEQQLNFASDLVKIADNFLTASRKLENVLFDEAVTTLKNAGWKFSGTL